MRPAFPSLMDRYIGRLMVMPLVLTVAISLMLLVLDKLLRLLDFVVVQAGSPRLVLPLLANIVPTYVSFALVVGLLLSVVFTFRRLALSSELDVLRAAGVSYGRMLAVPVCVAVALTCVNLAIIGFVQPAARYAYKEIQFDLVSGALGSQLHAGDFTMLGRSNMLRFERVANDELQTVFVSLKTRRRKVAIAAAGATFLANADRTAIVMRLRDGVLVESMDARPLPRVLQFAVYDVRVPMPSIGGLEPRGGELDELSVVELVARAGVTTSETAKRQALAQLNFRYVQLATLLLLPFLGLPLAVPPKRTSSFLGVLIAVVVLVSWYKVLQFSLANATAGRVHPVYGIWLPFLAWSLAVCWLYRAFALGTRANPMEGAEAVLAYLRNKLHRDKPVPGRRSGSLA